MSDLNNTTAGEVSYPDDYAAFEAAMQGGKAAEPVEAEETPSEDSNESESAGESETLEDTEQPAEEEKPEAEEEEKPEGKRGINQRISKLTQKIRGLEAELAATRQPQPQPAVAKPEQSAATEGRPKAEDFESYEEYVEALADYKVEQKLAKQTAEQQQKAAADVWTGRVEKAKESFADFDEVMENVDDIQFGDAIGQALMESELGPQIAYHLAKNRAEAERIAKLSPVAQIKAIGAIEDKLLNPPAPKPKPKVSSAPEPITPVTKPSATRAVRFDDPDVDFTTFEKVMNKRSHRY